MTTVRTSADPVAVRSAAPVPRPDGRPGWLVMWGIEMTKLGAQTRTRVVMALCLVGPALFVAALSAQTAVPADTLFGRWVHESGFAVSLVVLGFSGQWALPIVLSVVAGDLCAEEDRLHTWSLLLTRSRSRGEVFTGKVLTAGTATVTATLLLAISATLSGIVVVGTQPLVGLSGSMLSSRTALVATVLSWLSVLAPALAVAAIAVVASVLSRNSWVGVLAPVVVVLVLDLVSLLSAVDPVRPFLPTTGFSAWYGLVRAGAYSNQIWTSVLVSAGWVVVCLTVAGLVVTRRDVVDA